MKLTVVIGDVHGCIDELNELLKTIQYKPEQMQLVFLGDLVHRGPDSLACIKRVMELNAKCVKGNHEEKLLRWRKHNDNFSQTGIPNPMKPISEEEVGANLSMSDKELSWMKNLPLKLDLGMGWWAVHAGCEPRYTLEKQNPSQIMRVRYVDDRGIGKALNPDKSQPENTVYWDQQWQGPESIVYGHCVHDLKQYRMTSNNGVHCVGIDTGCCFGGHLTAMIMEKSKSALVSDNETWTSLDFVQVQAKKAYYTRHGEE